MADRLLFSKTGRAKYISHLDLMRTFQRAFARAGIAIKHTEGFNPHPFVSIALPLSVGYSSQCEILEFGLLEGADPEAAHRRHAGGHHHPPVLSGTAEAEGADLPQLHYEF